MPSLFDHNAFARRVEFDECNGVLKRRCVPRVGLSTSSSGGTARTRDPVVADQYGAINFVALNEGIDEAPGLSRPFQIFIENVHLNSNDGQATRLSGQCQTPLTPTAPRSRRMNSAAAFLEH